MRTIIWFIRAVFYLVAALPCKIKATRLRDSGDYAAFRKYADDKVQDWARKMLSNAGVTVEVHGLENLTGKPAIFVANHQSDFDIMLLLGYLDAPHGIVAKDSLSKVPMIGFWMSSIDCIFIDRNNPRKALKTMNEAGKIVVDGRSIIIFPEGTRSCKDEIGEFKAGAFKTAFKYNLPVVPLAIDGTYKVMEGNKGKRIRPAHVILTVLPEIETDDIDKDAQKNFGDEIKKIIEDGREETRRKISKSKGGIS